MSERTINIPDWLLISGAAMTLMLLVGLPVYGIYELMQGFSVRAVAPISLWLAMMLCVFALRIRAKKAEAKANEDRIAERKQNGVARRDHSYEVVDPTDWDPAWNWRRDGFIDWVEGERQELQEGDVVLRYFQGHGMAIRAGYAIERNGIIVAQVLTLMS